MSRYYHFKKNDPQPRAICDRCGFQWERRQLTEQLEYRGGEQPVGIGILVCPTCNDEPQPYFARPRVKRDPTPVPFPRPEPPIVEVPIWILATSDWNDDGVWLDSAVWID